ncbi:MAG TPA: hypothetical protein PLY62_08835 [Bacteroidales bacterium]|nr:hypothetical protein [Saprospiraceae bacterium]HPH54145.1 hypothetical protein [Bacteroidales bacterium]
MGADKPEIKKIHTQTPLPFVPILMGGIILIVALFKATDFSSDNQEPKLSPKEEAKLEKRLKEIDDSEQYALIAVESGYFACLHSGKTVCYLQAGEIWKYGVTSKGEFGRYAGKFLRNHRVSYIAQFKGNMAECLKQEQIKLFNYPFLPENVARPLEERLPRPPFNPIMR